VILKELDPIFMFFRKAIAAALLLMMGMSIYGTPDASAQRWLQTSQLAVEMGDGPSRALLDTLIQVIERSDSLKVQRSPDSEEKIKISTLRDNLINGPGIGLGSANNVFIDYRFTIENRGGFQESIEAFQFLYRAGPASEDIKILYLDANEPWVRNLLRNKGTPPDGNEAGLRPFADQLAFARMHKDAKIVEISGEPVREGFETKKRKLVQKITRLTYESM